MVVKRSVMGTIGMPRYLLLIEHDAVAASWLLEGGGSAHAAREQAVADYGGQLIASQLLIGTYDHALTVEFPDDAKCFAFSQAVTSWGSRVEILTCLESADAERAAAVAREAGEAVQKRLAETPPTDPAAP
jgi:uncharacterized protein with GYD domain